MLVNTTHSNSFGVWIRLINSLCLWFRLICTDLISCDLADATLFNVVYSLKLCYLPEMNASLTFVCLRTEAQRRRSGSLTHDGKPVGLRPEKKVRSLMAVNLAVGS